MLSTFSGNGAYGDGALSSDGNTLYLVNWNTLDIVDVSDPSSPQLLGSTSTYIDQYGNNVGGYSDALVLSNDGKVAIGHTNPEAQLDIQYTSDPGASDNDADRALNVRAGSINVDIGQGLNTGRMGLISGEKDYVRVASAKKVVEEAEAEEGAALCRQQRGGNRSSVGHSDAL